MDRYDCPPEIEQAMENWRRWATGSTTRRHRCQSLESRYRSSDVFEQPVARIEIDILAALKMERIVCSLPHKYRAAVRGYHIHRYPHHVMKRKLREYDVGCLMIQAWDRIKYLLTNQKGVPK